LDLASESEVKKAVEEILREERNKDKYDYNRFGSKGKRVGQAVVDILANNPAPQTVEETIEAFGPDFAKELEDTIEKNRHKYTSPFYVFVLTKKEMWACNVLRNLFIARQTDPLPEKMVIEYPNYLKTLYKVDADIGHVEPIWSIPGHQECISISRHPEMCDPQLVKWIDDTYNKIRKNFFQSLR
jgi:hypothetical protein